jgi:hypothetical protein
MRRERDTSLHGILMKGQKMTTMSFWCHGRNFAMEWAKKVVPSRDMLQIIGYPGCLRVCDDDPRVPTHADNERPAASVLDKHISLN